MGEHLSASSKVAAEVSISQLALGGGGGAGFV